MSGDVMTAHVADLLPGCAAGTLDTAERERVRVHLPGCTDCRAELDAWQVIRQAAQSAYAVPMAADGDVLPAVWHRIDGIASAGATRPDPGTSGATTAAPVPIASRRDEQGRGRRALALLATAALIVLTLAGSLFTVSRTWRQQDRSAFLPAISGTPLKPETVHTETLLDTTADGLVAGQLLVAVDRWRLSPSDSEVILPAHEGAVQLLVDSGQVTVTVNGSDHRLEPGDARDVANREFGFRASGSEEAVAYIVYATPRFPGFGANRLWKSGDPLVHSRDKMITGSADAFAGGPAQLVLKRITIPPGGTLPPQQASPLVWIQVGSGELGLKLEGDRLPFRWKPDEERTIFQFGREPIPYLAPGTTMLMRNSGDEPLVLYRLEVVPDSASATVRPEPTSQSP